MSNQTLAERPATASEVAVTRETTPQVRVWPDWQKLVALVVLVLAANVPLLYLHFKNLLSRSYYDFAYVLPLAIVLMYRHYGGVHGRRSRAPHVMKATIAAAFTALLLTGAIYLWSPWLAAVGTLVAIPTLVYCVWGADRLAAIIPAWLLGWLVIPPPLIYGETLTESLRGTATVCASRILDSLGILHLTEGNVITTAKGSLFIADACSGVNSLYSLLALALFYCLWARRHWLHTLAMVSIVVPVVLLENAIRISLIPLWLEYFNVDLSVGWKHTVLGFILFLLSGALIASFDQLLLFMAPLVVALKDLVSRGRRRRAEADRTGDKLVSPQNAKHAHLLAAVLTFFLIAGGIAQVGLFARTYRSLPRWQSRKIDVSQITATTLPNEWNGWKRSDFENIERAVEDPFGNWSSAWTFTRGGQVAKFSLDYAWPDPHDLTVCYRAIGWSLANRRIDESHELPFVSVALHKRLHADSLLLFSLHNLEGDTAVRFRENRPLANKFVKKDALGPWYQVQLLTTGFEMKSERDVAELEAMFSEFRRIVIQKIGK